MPFVICNIDGINVFNVQYSNFSTPCMFDLCFNKRNFNNQSMFFIVFHRQESWNYYVPTHCSKANKKLIVFMFALFLFCVLKSWLKVCIFLFWVGCFSLFCPLRVFTLWFKSFEQKAWQLNEKVWKWDLQTNKRR